MVNRQSDGRIVPVKMRNPRGISIGGKSRTWGYLSSQPYGTNLKKAGFISVEWLPSFVNSRRSGYDFDARWEDGKVGRREKKIMDFFLSDDEDEPFKDIYILSTDLKKQAGFGKGGEKNYQGIITQLQMETYLVISDFKRRENKKGEEYGMAVSVMLPPEKLWGYDRVTSAYSEKPSVSWERLVNHVKEMYPGADEKDIVRLIGKRPED